jgi:hypothetical protein
MVVLYEVDPSNYGLIYVGRFSRPDNYAKHSSKESLLEGKDWYNEAPTVT